MTCGASRLCLSSVSQVCLSSVPQVMADVCLKVFLDISLTSNCPSSISSVTQRCLKIYNVNMWIYIHTAFMECLIFIFCSHCKCINILDLHLSIHPYFPSPVWTSTFSTHFFDTPVASTHVYRRRLPLCVLSEELEGRRTHRSFFFLCFRLRSLCG